MSVMNNKKSLPKSFLFFTSLNLEGFLGESLKIESALKSAEKNTFKSNKITGLSVLQQQQNLGPRFGTSKMDLSPPVTLAAVPSKVVVLLLICY